MKGNGNVITPKSKDAVTDLPRLLKALGKSGEFSLHFVLYDTSQTRDYLLDQISRLEKLPLKKITLDKQSSTVEALLQKLASIPTGKCALIDEFDKAVMPNDNTYRFELLDGLNQQLFELRKFARPVVLLLPINFMESLREDAPDLWEWRAATYLFEETDRDRYRTAYYISDHFADSNSAETYARKQNLLSLYHTLNIEYQDESLDDGLLLQYNVSGKIAALLYKLGEYKKAYEQLNQQMDLAMLIGNEKLFPEILNNIGNIYEASGSYEEALTYLNQAWKIGEKHLRGDYHPAKAVIMGNIGNVYCSLGDYNEAFLRCRKALRMAENKLGMRHHSLIPVLLKMGRVLRKRKLFEDALDHYRRALQIVESRLQIENPYASAILQQIGMAYYGQNKLDLARRYVYRTLEMTERAFGAEHPYLGMILNNVGLTHFHTDNGDTALKYFFWASEIRTNAVGADDFTVGTIYSNIARVYQTQGKYSEAQMCLRKTLDIYRAKLTKNHPYIRNVQESLLVVEEALAADG